MSKYINHHRNASIEFTVTNIQFLLMLGFERLLIYSCNYKNEYVYTHGYNGICGYASHSKFLMQNSSYKSSGHLSTQFLP